MFCKCAFKNTSLFLWFIGCTAATFATRSKKADFFSTNPRDGVVKTKNNE